MKSCLNCLHYVVCGEKDKISQTDAFAKDNQNNFFEAVAKVCRYHHKENTHEIFDATTIETKDGKRKIRA